MVTIDLLTVLFTLELIFVVVALVVLLYLRNKKLKKKLSSQKDELSQYLKKTIEKLTKASTDAQVSNAPDGKYASGTPYESIMLNVYSIADEVLQKQPKDTPLSVKELSEEFEKQLEVKVDILQSIGTPGKYPLSVEEVEKYVGQQKLERFKVFLHELKKQNITLIGYKDTITGVIKKFKMVLEFNRRLQSNFQDLAQMYDGLDRIYSDFETNNAELGMCIEILDKENEYLDDKVKNFKSTFNA
ncbi:MAG: hypothetical protein L3V56_07380 [Candidatus Magnetoovum sp. WYHC-5]|nr:hypothetical protein [Candidatus Magnetoovum sp. WYHC-5]